MEKNEILIPQIKAEIVELEYGYHGQISVAGDLDETSGDLNVYKLSAHRNRDKAMAELVKEIHKVIDEILKDK